MMNNSFNSSIKNIMVIASAEADNGTSQEESRLTACFSLLSLFSAFKPYPIALTYLVNEQTSWRGNSHCSALSKEQFRLLKAFDINEQLLINTCDGHYCLGEHFVFPESKSELTGERNKADCYLVSGDYGVNFNHIEFQHYFSYAVEKDSGSFSIEDFSLAGQMVKQNRFVHPNSDANSILSTFDYAMNVNTQKLVGLLERKIKKLPVYYVNANRSSITKEKFTDGCVDVNTDINRKFITEVLVAVEENKQVVKKSLTADFYIDCSGQNNHSNIDNAPKLPSDAVLFSFYIAGANTNHLANKISTHEFGWIKINHLQKGRYIELCCSAILEKNDAIRLLNENSLSVKESDIVSAQFFPQKSLESNQVNCWQGNVLSLNSYSHIEPLLNSYLDMALQAINSWVAIFPNLPFEESVVNFYNKNAAKKLATIKYIESCYYELVIEQKTDFWLSKREQSAEEVKYLLSLFQATGNIPEDYVGYFNRHQWRGYLLGLGLIPVNQDPLIFNEKNISDKLMSLRHYIHNFTAKLPSYSEYIEQYRSFNE